MLTPIESIRLAYKRWKSIPVQSDVDVKIFERFMKATVMMSGSTIDHRVLESLWRQGSVYEDRSHVHGNTWSGSYYLSVALLYKALYCALTDRAGYNPSPYISHANEMITDIIQYSVPDDFLFLRGE